MVEFMRDVLNVLIVLGTPFLIFWLILRPGKAAKAAKDKASE